MTKKKILYILECPKKNRPVHDWILRDLQDDYDIILAYMYAEKYEEHDYAYKTVCFTNSKKSLKMLNPYVLGRLYRELRREGVHIVQADRFKCLEYALLAGIMAGVKGIIFSIGSEYIFRNWQRRLILRVFTRRLSAISVISNPIKDEIIRSTSYPPERIKVIHRSIETEDQIPLIDKTKARHCLGLPEKGFFFGMTARLKKAKYHKGLLNAFQKLAETHSEIHLALAGDGPLEEELKKQVEILGVESQVHFMGWLERSKIPFFLSALDVYIHTPVREGLGNACLEAMARGLPIIASSAGGIRDIFDTNWNIGYMIPPGDISAATLAMGKIIHLQENERQEMGHNAFRRVQADFSVQAMVSQTRMLYESLLQGQNST